MRFSFHCRIMNFLWYHIRLGDRILFSNPHRNFSARQSPDWETGTHLCQFPVYKADPINTYMIMIVVYATKTHRRWWKQDVPHTIILWEVSAWTTFFDWVSSTDCVDWFINTKSFIDQSDKSTNKKRYGIVRSVQNVNKIYLIFFCLNTPVKNIIIAYL